MGIIDMLAEKARAEQAAPVVPALEEPRPTPVLPVAIPTGTPTPAVTPADIAGDKAARQAAAEAARVDPEAAMAGAQIVPTPPEPKVIPIGTPSPAVTPEAIAADKEARRLAAQAALGGGQPEGTPNATPVAPVEPVATPTAAVPPIAQQVPATLPEQEEAAFAMGQLVPEQSTVGLPAGQVAEPTFPEKLQAVAKKRGRGFLDALQAGLYNFAGVTKPTDYEQRVEAEAAEKKDLLDKQWQAQMAQIGQDFQARQAELDRNFSVMIAKAKNDWDVQAAKTAHEQQAQENALDRQNRMAVAAADYQQKKTMTMDQLKQLLVSTYGGQ